MEIEKTDITQYCNNRLSLAVFKNKHLYSLRRNVRKLLKQLDELYIYNDAQLEVLLTDIRHDLGELWYEKS